ncbi:MAG TPA: hypothetical protein VFA20_02345 [Myxococcaceae bacterium]|nr:hypothetical protein [Myxococcaceae bacterium]
MAPLSRRNPGSNDLEAFISGKRGEPGQLLVDSAAAWRIAPPP